MSSTQEMLNLKQLVCSYELPVRATVRKGHYGLRNSDSLSEGERIAICFVKEEEVVIAQDRRQKPISIPLNTEATFRILDRDPKRTRKGKKQPNLLDLQAMTVSQLVEFYKFPLFVQLAGAGNDLASAKSAMSAIHLTKVAKVSNVFAKIEDLEELICMPIDLDVAFNIDHKIARVRKHQRNIYEKLPEFKGIDTREARGIGTMRMRKLKREVKPPLPPRQPIGSPEQVANPYDNAKPPSSGDSDDEEYAYIESDYLQPSPLPTQDAKLQRRFSLAGNPPPKPPNRPLSHSNSTGSVTGGLALNRQPPSVPQTRSGGAALGKPRRATANPQTMRRRPGPPSSAPPPATGQIGMKKIIEQTSMVVKPAGPPQTKQVDPDQPKAPLHSFQPPDADAVHNLDIPGVCAILKGMNLERYCPKFIEEQIDGDMFLELDHDMLEEDLGIKNKLHRTRILKTIEKSKKAQASSC